MRHYYEILGLEWGASPEAVKQAYRKLAKTYHPDRYQDPAEQQAAKEKFQTIQTAYEALKGFSPSSARSAKPEAHPSGVSIRTKSRREAGPRKPSEAEIALKKGIEQFQAQQYMAALDFFSFAIHLQPDFAEAYWYRSQLRQAKGWTASAQEDLAKAKQYGWVPKQEPSQAQQAQTHQTQTQQAARSTQSTRSTHAASTSPSSATSSHSPSTSWRLHQTWQGHGEAITGLGWAKSTLISISTDTTLRLWHWPTGAEQAVLASHRVPVTAISVAAQRGLLVTGGKDGQMKMWNLPDKRLIRTVPLHQGAIQALAMDTTEQLLASAGEDGQVKLFRLNPATLLKTLTHRSIVWSVLFNAPGTQLITTSADQCLRLWQCPTGELLREIALPSPCCYKSAISPDGQTLVVSDDQGNLHLWSIVGDWLKTIPAHGVGAIQGLQFSSCGTLLFTGGTDGEIKLWDAQTWQRITHWSAEQGAIQAFAWIPSANWLVSAGSDGSIKTWKAL